VSGAVEPMTVAVFGASGRQGQAQVRRLVAEGHRPRAVTRTRGLFENEPVEVRPADYADTASLRAVLDGVDAAFFQPPMDSPPEQTLAHAANLAEAMEAAGLPHLVFSPTMWLPQEPIGQPLYDLMLGVHDLLAARDIPMTVLCPTIFMDNWLARFAKPALVTEHVYRYPHRTDFEMSPISLDDMAKFMVAALGRDDLVGRRLRVAGPETLTPPRIAEALSAAMGVEVRHEYMTPRAFGEYLYTFMGIAETGISKDDYGSFIESYYEFNMTSPERPFAFDVAQTLEVLPVQGLETFAQWAVRQDWTTLDDVVGSTTG
jgi:uncharacterized protein YbjT (DUF2867 family)